MFQRRGCGRCRSHERDDDAEQHGHQRGPDDDGDVEHRPGVTGSEQPHLESSTGR